MLHSLKHKMKLTTTAVRFISGKSQILRRLSTATSPVPSTNLPESHRSNITKQSLQKKLWAAVNNNGRIPDVLHQLIRDGEQFDSSTLLACLLTFRNYGHYHRCLEIFDWVDKSRSSYSATEYALRLNVMCKAKGIDDVEKYFDTIPPDHKNHHVYGALLNCYCMEMMMDKAVALFKKMDELNYVSNHLPFNSLMDLYMKAGNPEKLPVLVEEMKQRNIPLTNHSYYLWIQSYRYRVDLEGLEQVMQKVQEQSSVKDDWQIYSNLATVYIEANQFEKANAALKKMAELFNNPKVADRKAYHYLISMYASTGELASVYMTWQKLKSKFEVCQNMSYLTMLRALSTLNDFEGLKKILEEWTSGCKHYDDRVPAVVMGSYLRHDMLEDAKQLFKDVEKRAEKKIKTAHVIFMNYYLGKHQFDSALEHFEAAIGFEWKPQTEKLDPFFEHFIEEKDVDSAEEFCRKIEEVQPLGSRTYLWLLQTYAAAGKEAPNMRQRMEENGINISAEHEELLQKIC